MTKQEWKDRHSAVRAIYISAIRMDRYKKTKRRRMALNEAWELIYKWGFADVMHGKNTHITYPLRQNKWAIHHNCSNY